ncbi:MAG: 5-oxoprolinase subunit PxpA [Opitutaceae bacterium]
MAGLIINCDLGENESAEQTEALLALVDAANVCCGVHAGSIEKTRETLLLAKAAGVLVGAHPGMSATGGRGEVAISAASFRSLLVEQLGAFLEVAESESVPVRYVKLHGSLYHAVEQDVELLNVYLDTVAAQASDLGVFGLAGGACVSAARARDLKVWEEAFADRGYREDGSLVPRNEPEALLPLSVACQRFAQWKSSGLMAAVRGESFALKADTFCVHSDSPDALELLRDLSEGSL